MKHLISFSCIIVTALAGLAQAQDSTANATNADNADAQFHAVAVSRSKAELSLRKLRTFFEQNEARWRLSQAAPEGLYRRIVETIAKTAQDEQRKPEDTRNQAVVEELNQRRGLVEQDWNRYSNAERAPLENTYRQAAQQAQSLWQMWANLANNETNWKDMKLDLPALQASYDALAKRSDEIKAAAEQAIASSDNWKKIWEVAADTSTRPVMPK